MFNFYNELDLSGRIETDTAFCEECLKPFWAPIFMGDKFLLCEHCCVDKIKNQKNSDTEKEIEKIIRIFKIANTKVN
jgi:hypothetical protein